MMEEIAITLGKMLIKLVHLMYMAQAVLDFVMAGTGVNAKGLHSIHTTN